MLEKFRLRLKRMWALAKGRRIGAALHATLITTLGLLAGLWGSLYSTEIRGAWPFQRSPYQGISLHAVSFWTFVTVATLLFFWMQFKSEEERRAAEARLTEQAAKLEDLIRTQPPEEFLALGAQLCSQCFATHDALQVLGRTGPGP
jgi:hypothetical protein